MRNKLSIIAKYTILFLTAAPLVSIFVLPLRQKAIQHHMKEALEKKELHRIILSEKNVHWIKPGKEIWVENRMFDIKSCKYENGIYSFYGLFDEKETEIVKQMRMNFPDQNSSTNKILSQLFQLFHFTQKNLLPDFLVIEPTNTTQSPEKRFILLTQFISIPAPPPKA